MSHAAILVIMLALAGITLGAFHFTGIIRQDLHSAVHEMKEETRGENGTL